MRNREVGKRIAAAMITFVLFLAAAGGAQAATVSIPLSSGWNLISIPVQPVDPAVSTVLDPLMRQGSLVAIWSYDASTATWSTFPAAPGLPTLSDLVPGNGYWIRVTRTTVLQIAQADQSVPTGPGALASGWNLIAFPLQAPVPYASALSGLIQTSSGAPSGSVTQIWTYDAAGGRFRGVVFRGNNPPLPEDFTTLVPGAGYWILATDGASLAPQLGTSLPPDLDVPPLLPAAPYGMREPFTPLTPGDEDIGLDGFFDQPNTQRAATFHDTSDVQMLSIFNTGKGVLSWRATIDDPDNPAHTWLRFQIPGQNPGENALVTSLSGTVDTGTAALTLAADRTGLPPGGYHAVLHIDSNGQNSIPPSEPIRTVDIFMQVPELDGDYQVTAQINTINGRLADTHNPHLFLSLYHDVDGLKGMIDGARTLLVPEYCIGGSQDGTSCSVNGDCPDGRCQTGVRLAGSVYEDGTNKFILSGSFELPVGSDGNPYQVPLRRDITLVGDRRGPGDTQLGPQDLKGEYYETIRNVLGQPAFLAGTFTASRVAASPTALDTVLPPPVNPAGNIPDDGAHSLTQSQPVADVLLLSQVHVTVNITHLRPADLIVTLKSPHGTVVRLRDRSTAGVGLVTYADTATPVDSLADFNGELSNGTWMLKVLDADPTPGGTGSLLGWSLNLQGTRVSSITGKVANVGTGATVLLTGCGLSETTTTASDGSYSFGDLIDCAYEVTLLQSGFERVSQTVDLKGTDQTAVNLPGVTAPPDMEIPVVLPADSAFRFVSLTTSAGAGLLVTAQRPSNANVCAEFPVPEFPLQYAMDSATFDIDRPPLDPNSPGPEDSNEFIDPYNLATGTNFLGCNSRIDGPCTQPDGSTCANSRHIFVGIGGPVIGTSVSGNTNIAIGANP